VANLGRLSRPERRAQSRLARFLGCGNGEPLIRVPVDPAVKEDLSGLAGTCPLRACRAPRLRRSLARRSSGLRDARRHLWKGDSIAVEARTCGRALLLAAFVGHTARDIGALDGTLIGTVETRIGAAMLKLRGLLAVRDG
jgi:hypothetical protein